MISRSEKSEEKIPLAEIRRLWNELPLFLEEHPTRTRGRRMNLIAAYEHISDNRREFERRELAGVLKKDIDAGITRRGGKKESGLEVEENSDGLKMTTITIRGK